jgi:hypothetical protein
MPDLDTDDLAALIKACDVDLGYPNLWFTPDGYPDSLALCIVDSIYSTGARYSSVVNVVGRYREYRTNQGGDPNNDGTDELAATISELGGPGLWATRIGNRRPTSTAAGAPLKTETIATLTGVRRRSSTCRSRFYAGACRQDTEALTCRSLALWPMPPTCGTTPSWCPRG